MLGGRDGDGPGCGSFLLAGFTSSRTSIKFSQRAQSLCRSSACLSHPSVHLRSTAHPSALHERFVENLGEWGKARRQLGRAVGMRWTWTGSATILFQDLICRLCGLLCSSASEKSSRDTMAGWNKGGRQADGELFPMPIHYHKLHKQASAHEEVAHPCRCKEHSFIAHFRPHQSFQCLIAEPCGVYALPG